MRQLPVENRHVLLEQEPDHCPICHHACVPAYITHTPHGLIKDDDFRVEIAYRCPRLTCDHIFVARCFPIWPQRPSHITDEQLRQSTNPVRVRVSQLVPTELQPPLIPDEVSEISPAFKTIYSQAVAAEAYGLTEIAGVGFRKSLEFLIKDFASHKNSSASEKIKSLPLSVCIKDFVDDANIKTCANRATWLGNDETHYVRKWEGKDLSDLKVLVQLTINWVRNSILTEKYMAEMP